MKPDSLIEKFIINTKYNEIKNKKGKKMKYKIKEKSLGWESNIRLLALDPVTFFFQKKGEFLFFNE